MPRMKRWLLILGAGFVLLNLIIIALALIIADFLVDFWWFDSLGYSFYFLQRLLYRYVVLISVTFAFFLFFFLNFWVASRYLGTYEQGKEQETSEEEEEAPSRLKKKARKTYKELMRMFLTGSMWVYTPLSFVLAIIIALPLFEQWEMFLLYLVAPTTGVAESTFGKDISYYLFSYPIYILLLRRLLLAFLLLFAALVILYLVERKILASRDQSLARGARWHLSALILVAFFIEIWHFLLQAHGMVYSTSHLPLFFGAGFTEMNVVLPLIWLSLFFLMGTAFSLIAYMNARKGLLVLAGFTVLFFAALGLRHSTILPQLVQKYIVQPNEIHRERPYINKNIEATLAAFKLDDVETREFSPSMVMTDVDTPRIKAELRNIPVWDGEYLEDVFQQLQQLRTYYQFSSVDVARYYVNNRYQQVFLSARELDHEQLPPGARNWINQHLSYTHGYGAVMVPASQGGDEPMTWFIRGIPPESDFGFQIKQPAIYHGLGKYSYSIAPNDTGEMHYPKGASNVIYDYTGKSGVRISSLFKKLLFAYYFGDRDVFFTTKTNPGSRILFRQNILDRIKILTPFITLDRDPYLVVTNERLFWIQDAYTTSIMYPYATPYHTGQKWVNYIRNSVKIVVDAYDGTVDYYIFESDDPIITAYSRIYPGLFKSRAQMPPELLTQVRYPMDIFTLQTTVYAKYQQRDPEVFYQQEDMWDFAKIYRSGEPINITPYYLTLDLISPPRSDFLLLCPMSPKGRDNLRSLVIAGCDPPFYGKIIVYDFPKGELVHGPSQIYALINQDTTIAQQFTLWDQIGSEVARGKMIILPVGEVILYIQPVYLKAATQLKIPELKRLIMSQGQVVVMERSLEEAYAELQQRTESEMERIRTRFAPMAEPPLTPAPTRFDPLIEEPRTPLPGPVKPMHPEDASPHGEEAPDQTGDPEETESVPEGTIAPKDAANGINDGKSLEESEELE